MTEHPRRIDRVLSESFLAGIGDQSVDELHAMEHEVLEVETEISYVRRLAQGRIDILEAERDRRAAGGSLGDLIAALPKILADDGRSDQANTRAQSVLAPSGSIEWNRGLERLVSDATLVTLPTLTEAELQATLSQLRELENDLSTRRRALHGVIDALTRAIAERLAANATG